MAVYALEADITRIRGLELLQSVASRDGSGVVDSAAVADACTSMSSYIDTYIGERYSLPLSTVPDVLIECCVDLAIHHLAEGPGGGMSKTIERRKERWDCNESAKPGWLQRVAMGKAGIGLSDSDEGPSVDATADIESDCRSLSRASLGGLL